MEIARNLNQCNIKAMPDFKNKYELIYFYIQMSVKICIYNVIPPPDSLKVENQDFPIRGSIQDRIKYAKYFNQKLKEGCLLNNFIFIDIYNSYANKDGSLNMDLSDGIIHIKNSVYLEKKLYALKIIKVFF